MKSSSLFKKRKKKAKLTLVEFLNTAIPVAAALVLFLASAGFIVFKAISAYNYNERWKDYDECGLS